MVFNPKTIFKNLILNSAINLPIHKELRMVGQHITNKIEFTEKFSDSNRCLRDSSHEGHNAKRVSL
jgi:hypothetical protein